MFVVLKGPRHGSPLSAHGLDEIVEGRRPVLDLGMQHVTSCVTPVSPGYAKQACPSKRSRPRLVTRRSKPRGSICISPMTGLRRSIAKPLMRSTRKAWEAHDERRRTTQAC